MEVLKNIIEILNIKRITGLSSRELQLYNLIKKGKNRPYIIDHLFSRSENPTRTYNEVKNLLRKKLLNKLFNNLPLASYKKEEIKLRQEFNLFLILRAKSKESSYKLGQNILKRAKELELVDIVWKTSNLLQMYAIEIHRNNNQYRFFKKESELALEQFNIESKIYNQYVNIINNNNIELIEYQPISYRSGVLYFLGNAYFFEKQKDYQNIVRTYQDAIKFFSNKKYDTTKMKNIFYHRLIPASILLNVDASEKIEKALSLESKESINYFHLLSYQILNLIRLEQYNEAIELSKNTLKKVKQPYNRQQIKIITAWAYLVSNQPFRISKLMNEVHLFEKEKSQDNASLRLLEAFFLIRNKQFNKLISKQDALKLYASRYTDGRIKLVFQILDQLINKSFMPPNDREINKTIKQIQQLPYEDINIEVIRYEKLIRWAVLHLNK